MCALCASTASVVILYVVKSDTVCIARSRYVYLFDYFPMVLPKENRNDEEDDEQAEQRQINNHAYFLELPIIEEHGRNAHKIIVRRQHLGCCAQIPQN